MSLDPKVIQKFDKGEVKNNLLTLKPKKGGGGTKQKGRPLSETLKENTKSHLDVL
jgi:hypothetical protein